MNRLRTYPFLASVSIVFCLLLHLLCFAALAENLAIIYSHSGTGVDKELTARVVRSVGNEVHRSGLFTIIPQKKVDEILSADAIRLARADTASPKYLKKLGRILGARYFITVFISQRKQQVALELKLIDTSKKRHQTVSRVERKLQGNRSVMVKEVDIAAKKLIEQRSVQYGHIVEGKGSVNKAANVAIGKSEAYMGAVKVKPSVISKTKIVNKANVRKSANVAIGGADIDMGPVRVTKVEKTSVEPISATVDVKGTGSVETSVPESGETKVVAVTQQKAKSHTKQGDFTIVKTFYATDREVTDSKDMKKRYSSARGDGLSYGHCYITIPKSHKVGELESPRWSLWESKSKHVVFHDLETVPLETFYKNLQKYLRARDYSAAFIFVHGYNVSFENAARRTAQIAHDLGFQGAPLFYSWPSGAKVKAYFSDEANIKWTQANLQRFLTDFFNRSTAENIYLIAHSMGNRALTRALVNVAQDIPNLRERLKEVILAAPDIDAGVFKNQIAPKLAAAGCPITLYASSNDKALIASKKVHKYPRLGDTSDGVVVLNGIETIDASGIDTSFLGHSYIANTKTIINDIYYLINFNIRAAKRNGLRPQESNDGRYWVFAR